jgi:hypothetical protein
MLIVLLFAILMGFVGALIAPLGMDVTIPQENKTNTTRDTKASKTRYPHADELEGHLD